MHLRGILLVAVFGLLSSCNIVSATSKSEAIVSRTATSIRAASYAEGGKRHEKVNEDAQDEERGLKDAAKVAAHKLKIPGWLLKKKTPAEVAEELGMEYPLVMHKLWPVIKSYQKQYDRIHIKYP
uniref:RxLR effector protein n=1 Tax=Phytophthora sojae TaxID=67593 RepID=G1FSP7_PHYSO|nr:Avh305 [Phytophthora sojae]